MNSAWDLGVRYYDTAPLYGLGLSETRLNRFLRSKNKNDYILSSKVGRMKPCKAEDQTGIGKCLMFLFEKNTMIIVMMELCVLLSFL